MRTQQHSNFTAFVSRIVFVLLSHPETVWALRKPPHPDCHLSGIFPLIWLLHPLRIMLLPIALLPNKLWLILHIHRDVAVGIILRLWISFLPFPANRFAGMPCLSQSSSWCVLICSISCRNMAKNCSRVIFQVYLFVFCYNIKLSGDRNADHWGTYS